MSNIFSMKFYTVFNFILQFYNLFNSTMFMNLYFAIIIKIKSVFPVDTQNCYKKNICKVTR